MSAAETATGRFCPDASTTVPTAPTITATAPAHARMGECADKAVLRAGSRLLAGLLAASAARIERWKSRLSDRCHHTRNR